MSTVDQPADSGTAVAPPDDEHVTSVHSAYGYRAECSCGWVDEEIEEHRYHAEAAAQFHAEPGYGSL